MKRQYDSYGTPVQRFLKGFREVFSFDAEEAGTIVGWLCATVSLVGAIIGLFAIVGAS